MLVTAFKNCPMNVPYKVSLILTLREIISIRILRMRLISAIMNFIGPILLPFKNCPMNVLISLAEF